MCCAGPNGTGSQGSVTKTVEDGSSQQKSFSAASANTNTAPRWLEEHMLTVSRLFCNEEVSQQEMLEQWKTDLVLYFGICPLIMFFKINALLFLSCCVNSVNKSGLKLKITILIMDSSANCFLD